MFCTRKPATRSDIVLSIILMQ